MLCRDFRIGLFHYGLKVEEVLCFLYPSIKKKKWILYPICGSLTAHRQLVPKTETVKLSLILLSTMPWRSMGNGDRAPFILDLSTIWKCVVSFMPSMLYPWERPPGTHRYVSEHAGCCEETTVGPVGNQVPVVQFRNRCDVRIELA
jgi:hypothetical protein